MPVSTLMMSLTPAAAACSMTSFFHAIAVADAMRNMEISGAA